MHQAAQFEAINSDMSLAAVHERMVVFAQDEQGRLTHIDSARRGKACNCRCLACGEALIARHGQVKAHSFAHASGAECRYAIDAMLNGLARELIAARGCFDTPALTVRAAQTGPLGVIECNETIPSRCLQVESVAIDRCVHRQRPSVVMQVKGRALILEVTHAKRLDAGKRTAIEKLGLPAIELHLAEHKFATVAQFEQLLLGDIRRKRWIFNPKASDIQARLDGIVQQRLALQIKQHALESEQRSEQQRQEQAAWEAAGLVRRQEEQAALAERLRLQAEQDHHLRQERARLESIAQAASQKPQEARLQTLHYRMQDGGLMIRHESGGQVLIVPETGREQALCVLEQLGLAHDAGQGGYLATAADLADILPALMIYVKSVRSI